MRLRRLIFTKTPPWRFPPVRAPPLDAGGPSQFVARCARLSFPRPAPRGGVPPPRQLRSNVSLFSITRGRSTGHYSRRPRPGGLRSTVAAYRDRFAALPRPRGRESVSACSRLNSDDFFFLRDRGKCGWCLFPHCGGTRGGAPAPPPRQWTHRMHHCGRASLAGCGVPHFFFMPALPLSHTLDRGRGTARGTR